MKQTKTLLAALLIGCLTTTAQAGTVGDTIVIEKPAKVKIETRDSVQRIVINGSKDDEQFQYVQRIAIDDTSAVRRTIQSVGDFNKIAIPGKDGKPSKWSSSLHMNLGLNAALDTPSGYDFKLWPSFEIGFKWMADWHPYGKRNEWSTGLGLNWRHYRMDKDQYLSKTGQALVPVPYPAGLDHRKTSLHVYSLELPVIYTHYFDDKQGWGVSLGAIVNWNFSASANHQFETNDEHYDIDTKKIGQKPITVEGIAMLHIPSFIDVYCKYCPMQLFKDNRGLEMQQLSFGICF